MSARPSLRALLPAALSIPLFLGACAQVPAPEASSAAPMQDPLLAAVTRLVKVNYVEPVSDQTMREGALKGMLQALDPHSDYMPEQEYRSFMTETSGRFGGIGIELGEQDEQLTVIAPIDGTPAARAGLLTGDKILSVDGQPTKGMSLTEAVTKLRGPVGSSVVVGILRDATNEAIDVRLTREIIEVRPVKWRVERGLGYIRLSVFNERAAEGVTRAIADIRKQTKGEPKGWILDLRNDPGGLLDQAVDITDMFLDSGEIVSVKGRSPEDNRSFSAKRGDVVDGAPLVVIVNGGSASASEIVAGALQDHRRARVVGTQTFGKGSVQTIFPLGGYGAVRLTTARYYTPSGRSIQAVGIKPDILVEDDGAREPIFHEADLRGALRNEAAAPGAPAQRSAGAATPRRLAPRVPGQDQPDPQLDKAVELLTGTR